jgi:hypothetical protein
VKIEEHCDSLSFAPTVMALIGETPQAPFPEGVIQKMLPITAPRLKDRLNRDRQGAATER